jgi:hypothetical protein
MTTELYIALEQDNFLPPGYIEAHQPQLKTLERALREVMPQWLLTQLPDGDDSTDDEQLTDVYYIGAEGGFPHTVWVSAPDLDDPATLEDLQARMMDELIEMVGHIPGVSLEFQIPRDR